MTKVYNAGVAIRGRWIDDNLGSFGGRSAGVEFRSPDPRVIVGQLPLSTPDALSDLYRLSMDEILDYLERLGERLDLRRNAYLQEALEASCLTSPLTETVQAAAYESLAPIFNREIVSEMIDTSIGLGYLEGWVDRKMFDGRTLSVRAFGSRALHIIAGNGALIAALTVIRNAITRSDAIIKSPSNDPFTALAIARTMIEMAPDHPITRHISVAYWKGGDQAVEEQLYNPRSLEKIVAWGGFASIKHVTRYLQPGLQLISMDPKRSVSIIGPEAFASEAALRDVAIRLATDVGAANQEACASARVVYALSGTDDAGLAKLQHLARETYRELVALPDDVSTPCREMDSELRDCLEATKLSDDWYTVVGGEKDEGAVIVSHLPSPVDFAPRLGKRIANLVPVDSMDEVIAAVDSYTQTVGIYPDSLMYELRDRLPLFGAQRFTSLGYACNPSFSGPWDALEPLREMCRWVILEDCDPAKTPPMWEAGVMFRTTEAA
ncbi:acyl-CoA reductase [Flavisphingomonas formosensis]|uniref:acyl-CoA reductase n=1 Tax=Flavisphingomonas formosensis TaxID=861534 RepID=UPI0012F82B30|nr:acyl-CoA reductase [Sphingomonas formosensis]